LIADMVFGWLYYPDQMNLVTGWMHHVIYMFMIPAIMANHLAGAFMINMFMELPTIFLAIGYLFPPLRSEYLFGSTFFVTRIGILSSLVFHLFFAFQLHRVWGDRTIPIIASLCTFPLHIYWFSKWVIRQLHRISVDTHQRTVKRYPILRKIPFVKRLYQKLPPDEEEIQINLQLHLSDNLRHRNRHKPQL
jgi:uncharacterized protein with PQ loop repeat